MYDISGEQITMNHSHILIETDDLQPPGFCCILLYKPIVTNKEIHE